MIHYEFFQNALAGVLLISVACAIIGVYVVTRRMVFIAGGVTHACFGGLGLGYYLGLSPMGMAAEFAVAGSLSADWLARQKVRQDSAIAVMWALGMALGILFVFLTPGNVPELNSFLFGNVLNITRADLWIFEAFAVLAIMVYAFFGRVIVAVSFDEDFSRTRHLPVGLVNTVMMVMVSVCIVLAIKMIGVMMLMSLISLPHLTAERITSRYSRMMAVSGIVSAAGCVGGLWLSVLIDVPASATIVILLAIIFGLSCIRK